nr:hypothetical protein [Novosphingobium sp. ST904]
MHEIEHLRSGARTPTSPEAQAVVEDLSGWRYDQLWGRNSLVRHDECGSEVGKPAGA